ncbi:hypothetical protein ASwh1_130 [Aeromonas phage Aswh_1]|nr:hypothetical protein ASwh1_130 [Aeromonas phage Aswh_1]
MKVTEVGVRLSGIYVVCPHCKKEIDCWYVDPRGKKTTCDFCGKPIEIHQDADLEII